MTAKIAGAIDAASAVSIAAGFAAFGEPLDDWSP